MWMNTRTKHNFLTYPQIYFSQKSKLNALHCRDLILTRDQTIQDIFAMKISQL